MAGENLNLHCLAKMGQYSCSLWKGSEEGLDIVQNQCRRCRQFGHTGKEAKEEAENCDTANQPGLIKKYSISKYSWPGNELLQEVSITALAQEMKTAIE